MLHVHIDHPYKNSRTMWKFYIIVVKESSKKPVSVIHVQRCCFGAFSHFWAISLTNLVL